MTGERTLAIFACVDVFSFPSILDLCSDVNNSVFVSDPLLAVSLKAIHDLEYVFISLIRAMS